MEQLGKLILFHLSTDDTKSAGVFRRTGADINFTRDHIEVNPFAVFSRNHALRAQHITICTDIFKRFENCIDFFLRIFADGLFTPAGEYLICIMVVMMMIMAAAGAVRTMIVMMMFMLVIVVMLMLVVMVMLMFVIMLVVVIVIMLVVMMIVVMVMLMFVVVVMLMVMLMFVIMLMLVIVVMFMVVIMMIVVMLMVMLMFVIMLMLMLVVMLVVMVMMLFRDLRQINLHAFHGLHDFLAAELCNRCCNKCCIFIQRPQHRQNFFYQFRCCAICIGAA